MARVASDVGASGAKNKRSWPATMDVLVQSSRIKPGAEANGPHGNTVRGFRESSGEIKIYVRAGVSACEIRAKGLQPDLRLTERPAERSRGSVRLVSLLRFGE